jgi:hypothetical protein
MDPIGIIIFALLVLKDYLREKKFWKIVKAVKS